MGNCKDCRHWHREAPIGQYPASSGDMPEQTGCCWLATSGHSQRDSDWFVPERGQARSVCAGEGIGAELYTDAAFGCVRFEPK